MERGQQGASATGLIVIIVLVALQSPYTPMVHTGGAHPRSIVGSGRGLGGLAMGALLALSV